MRLDIQQVGKLDFKGLLEAEEGPAASFQCLKDHNWKEELIDTESSEGLNCWP